LSNETIGPVPLWLISLLPSRGWHSGLAYGDFAY
jgi:hypothetical protein